MKRVSAVTNRTLPGQSARPVAERDSRIRVAPDVISRPATVNTTKLPRQPVAEISRPDSVGPTAMPTPAMAPMSASARLRAAPS